MKRPSVAVCDFADAKHRRPGMAKHVFEAFAALDEGLVAEVRGPGAQHVEGDERRSSGPGSGLAALEMDPAL